MWRRQPGSVVAQSAHGERPRIFITAFGRSNYNSLEHEIERQKGVMPS